MHLVGEFRKSLLHAGHRSNEMCLYFCVYNVIVNWHSVALSRLTIQDTNPFILWSIVNWHHNKWSVCADGQSANMIRAERHSFFFLSCPIVGKVTAHGNTKLIAMPSGWVSGLGTFPFAIIRTFAKWWKKNIQRTASSYTLINNAQSHTRCTSCGWGRRQSTMVRHTTNSIGAMKVHYHIHT